MTYAIIKLGGKQYRVQEGEKLLVDRLALDESKTFKPDVLLLGGDGAFELAPKSAEVTVRVVSHVLGKKIRIGKYRRRTGYRRHTGHRSRLTQIEVESIGKKAARSAPAKEGSAEPKKAPAKKPAAKATPKAAAAKPKASTRKKKEE